MVEQRTAVHRINGRGGAILSAVPSLTPTTVLRRVAELEVTLSAEGDTLVVVDGGLVSCGPHGLAILDAFSQPTVVGDAIAALGERVRGAQDWIDLTSAIARLRDAGVLRGEDETESRDDRVVRGSFDTPGPHVAMLEDRVRTSAFLRALRELVGPEDVVVDIGTGTGILAAGAARAGARHVYAIEATPIAEHARQVFAANALDSRVTLVEGWSTRVTLPERADVAVGEILGSEALEERLLPVILDVRRRLLKPGGRLIPSVVRVFGVPVSIPGEWVDSVTFTPSNTARWSADYDIELSALAGYTARLRQRLTMPLDEVRGWETLSEPVLLVELDLATVETLDVEVTVPATATRSGTAGGALAFFEAQLSPGVVLSTSPAAPDPVTSWAVPVWLDPAPTELRPGQPFGLEYAYRNGAGHLRVVT
jgi:type I protein arginine methyltransferase